MDYEANGMLMHNKPGKAPDATHHRRAQLIHLTPSLDTDEAPRYERDQRSASPRQMRDDTDSGRRRSASPATNTDA
jgi:hypothetical protein